MQVLWFYPSMGSLVQLGVSERVCMAMTSVVVELQYAKEELETLRAECKRYREALEKIAGAFKPIDGRTDIEHEMVNIAKEALESR